MRKQASRRNALGIALTLVTFSLGLLVAVFVAGSASASSPLPTTTAATTTSSAPPSDAGPSGAMDLNSPQAQFMVINGSISAASDHEIVGSSAFPNFTTGAVDNYYSMSRAHMDNSPFNEATASPFDTGPVGQTAAAGNFQQPQYADARWPGGPDTVTYGSDRTQPFAEAAAYQSLAKADASESSNALSAPKTSKPKVLAAPKGFDSKLQKALAGWKVKYLGCPAVPKKPASPKVKAPAPPKVTVPKTPKVTVPGITTAVPTVQAPHTAAGSAPAPPSVQAPAPAVPSTGAPRSLSAVPSPCSSPGGSGSDGESLLASSALSVLVPGPATANKDINKVDTAKLETTPQTTTTTATAPTLTPTTPQAWKPKPYTLLMGGESSLGRVTLGNGQIVIDGIHVKASVANDGTATPAYTADISVASATIGGVPVTIDKDGVHVAGHDQGLPYQQASDGLNTALKQAGIEIFLAAPQVTNCAQAGSDTGTSTDQSTTTTTDTSTTSTDQSGTASPCGQAAPMCDPGMGGGTGTDTTSTTTTSPAPTPTDTSTTSTDQSGTGTPPGSCPPPPCGSGTATDGGAGGGTTTSTTTTTATTPTVTTTTTGQTDTTSTTQSDCPPPSPSPAGCATAGGAPSTSTTTGAQPGTTAPGATDPTLMGAPTNSGQETILSATGVHIVFTQPVSPPGVPAQFLEHILGEVYVDSLAAPAAPIPALGLLPSSLSSSSTSSSCPGGHGHSSSSLKAGGGGGGSSSTGGGSSLTAGAGTAGSGALSSSGSALGATSPTIGSSSTGSLPATIAAALKKPLWLLLAYLVWQALVIGTGWSLWNWRKDGPS